MTVRIAVPADAPLIASQWNATATLLRSVWPNLDLPTNMTAAQVTRLLTADGWRWGVNIDAGVHTATLGVKDKPYWRGGRDRFDGEEAVVLCASAGGGAAATRARFRQGAKALMIAWFGDAATRGVPLVHGFLPSAGAALSTGRQFMADAFGSGVVETRNGFTYYASEPGAALAAVTVVTP